MNIIKLQDQLKGMPDDALVGYVQNPTGNVPTYLALSELQRRKDMRSKYQANAPEDKTVAEDLVEEAQPQPGIMGLPEGQAMQQAMQPPPEMPMEEMAQGGLAELDTGDMYDENNYANGGIVAFADGGDTSTPWYRKMKVFGREYDPLPPSPNTIRGLQSKTSSNPFMGGMAGADSDPTVLLYKLKELHSKPNKTLNDWNQITEIEQKIKGGDQRGGYTPVEPPALPPTETSLKNQIEEAKKNPFADLTKDVYSGLTAPVEKVDSIKNYADEFKNYIGEDPMRQKLADRLAKMESKATKMEEQAPWLALAKAGFEMASARPEYGKGQSAIADIARGAGVGIKDYVEAKDRLNTLEEKRFNIENDLAKANRAEQIAVAKYGADSKQAAEARAHADKLHNSNIKTQFKIAELNASVNSSYRMATIKDKIDDNVRAIIKSKHGEGVLSPEEYDRYFKKYLAEEYAKYGLSGAPAVTESMPGNMVFDPKTKEYTYKPKS